MSSTETPGNVIGQYLTIGGAIVDLIEECEYTHVNVPTQTKALCRGCGDSHREEWGWDFWANERGEEQPDSYQQHGGQATPMARAWAQAHADTCRALPQPGASA